MGRVSGKGHHDMGGEPAGKVEPTEHDYADWERRVDALVTLLTGVRGEKRMTVDELRKNIEALGPQAYDSMSYYERWITSLTQTLLQRGIVTTEELARKMTDVENRSHHDMGGLPAGKVEPTEHDYADWERRVDAMAVLLSSRISVDERRRSIESLPPREYDAMSYYERWVMALGQTLIQRGLITTEELGRKMEQVCSRNS
jgi:hypothetical protein